MFRSSACSWLESVLKLQSTVFTHIHDVLGTIMFSLVGRGPHGLILDDILVGASAQKRKLEMSWNGFWPLLFPRICKNTYILEQETARHLPELTLHLTMPSGAIAPLERLVRADFANWEFWFLDILDMWTTPILSDAKLPQSWCLLKSCFGCISVLAIIWGTQLLDAPMRLRIYLNSWQHCLTSA